MAYRVKKFRGYRRMLRKLIRVVEDYQPDWRPDEADGREEFLELDLYSHRFFQKDRSLLTELGLSSTLPERCVLEEFHWAGYVERTLIWGYGELP